MPCSRQCGNVSLLLAPVEHVIAHLRDVDAPGAHALGHHGAGEVRDADEADAPGGHHLLEPAHGLLEGRARVRPVDEEHVHPVGAETLQARVDLAQDIGAARVPQGPGLAGGRRLHPALGDEDDVLAAAREGAPDDLLGVAAAVGRRGVHAVDAALEGAMDGLDGLVVLDRPVAVARHRPAPEAHHGHRKSSPAERAVAHGDPPSEISAPVHRRPPG